MGPFLVLASHYTCTTSLHVFIPKYEPCVRWNNRSNLHTLPLTAAIYRRTNILTVRLFSYQLYMFTLKQIITDIISILVHFLIAYCVCVAILISSVVEYLFLCDIAIDILPTRVSFRPSLSLYSWYGRGTTDVYHISFIFFSIVFYRCCCYCCLLPLFSPIDFLFYCCK